MIEKFRKMSRHHSLLWKTMKKPKMNNASLRNLI